MSAPQQSVRPLPDTPSLNSLKSQAKQLLSGHRNGEAESCGRFMSSHPDWLNASQADVQSATLSLSDAQLVVAREYGFESWPKLKHHVDAASPPVRGVLSELRDIIVDEHLASLERRHAPFAELLRRTLIFQGFSKDTEVSIEVERSTYGSLIGLLPNPCCVYTFFADQEYYGKPNWNRRPVNLDKTLPISGALLDGVTDQGHQVLGVLVVTHVNTPVILDGQVRDLLAKSDAVISFEACLARPFWASHS